MATQVQFRRGTTADTASFTGASGEITVDLTKHVCVVHDAIQVGGYPLMLESGVNSALSLGTLSNCSLKFLNDPNTGFFSPGPDQLSLVTGGVARITIDSAGAVAIPGNLLAGAILQMQSGTASAPALTFDGDTNTGIYSPGADQLAVSTGGTGRLFVDSSGRVGIGTSSPGIKLHVVGSAGTNFGVSDGSAYGLRIDNGIAYGLTGSTIHGVDQTFFGSYQPLTLNGSQLGFAIGGTERLRIDSSGRVGIGTSSPGYALDVNGASRIFNNAFKSSGASAVLNLAVGGSSGELAFPVAAVSGIDRYSDRSQYDGDLAFLTLGGNSLTEKMRITYGGNVGIGTTDPKAKLAVGDNGGYFAGSGSDSCSLVVQTANLTAKNGLRVVSNNYDLASEAYLDLVNFGSKNYEIESGFRLTSGVGAGGATSNHYLAFSTTTLPTNAIESSTVTLSEKMRIDSAGRLLVGTSTARTVREVIDGLTYVHQPNLQLETGNNSLGLSLITNRTADSTGPFITLGKSRGGTVGSVTVVQNGDELGNIYFAGADGTDIECIGAAIFAEVDGTPGADDMPGRLVFSTTADGASSPTERVRITQSGDTLFGCTAVPSASVAGAGFIPQSNGRSVLITSTSSTASNVLMAFYNPNGFVGNITIDGSATSYNTSSDYRLKENVVPLTGAIDRIQQIPVHRFNFIADPDKTVDGFIAHEAQAVVPECVTGEKDAVDDDGNPIYQGIDQSKLVPLLTAALQEAITKIETLEAAVAALQSA